MFFAMRQRFWKLIGHRYLTSHWSIAVTLWKNILLLLKNSEVHLSIYCHFRRDLTVRCSSDNYNDLVKHK